MTYFMPEDTRQFGLGIEVSHDAARDVDVTSGQRKGIDLLRVENREVKLQMRAVAFGGQLLTDAVNILL